MIVLRATSDQISSRSNTLDFMACHDLGSQAKNRVWIGQTATLANS
jgi:hypothetical protein